MAAAMGFRSPFFCPIDKREEADKARKTFATGHSDLLTTLKAFDGWQARPPLPHPAPHRVPSRDPASSALHPHPLRCADRRPGNPTPPPEPREWGYACISRT